MVEHHSHKIQNIIQKELFNAKSSIKIVVAWFTNDLLFQPLVLKQGAGVKVEIILNKDEINCSEDNSIDFDELVNAGGTVRWNDTKQLMHDKFCIIDDRIVIYGSYNWTNKAEYNEESITVSRDEAETINFYLDKYRKLSDKYPATRMMSCQKITHNVQTPFQVQPKALDHSADIHAVLRERSNQPYIKKMGFSSTKDVCRELHFYPEINIEYVGYRTKEEYVIIAKSMGSYYFVNPTTFLPINNIEFAEYRIWSDGLMWLMVDWKWGLFDTFKETFLLSPVFSNINIYQRKTAVEFNRKWGLIDKNGTFTLECKYDASSLSDQLHIYL